MHNPTLPIDRALNCHQENFKEFTREEEELKRKRKKKQEYNQNYKTKRQSNNEKKKEVKLRQLSYIKDYDERIKKSKINKKKNISKDKEIDGQDNNYVEISSTTSSTTSIFTSDDDYQLDNLQGDELIDMAKLQKESNAEDEKQVLKRMKITS